MPISINLKIQICQICGRPFECVEEAQVHEDKGIKFPNIRIGDIITAYHNTATDRGNKLEKVFARGRVIKAKCEPLPLNHNGLIIKLLIKQSDGTKSWEYPPEESYKTLPKWSEYLSAIQKNLNLDIEHIRKIMQETLALPQKTKEKILDRIRQRNI